MKNIIFAILLILFPLFITTIPVSAQDIQPTVIQDSSLVDFKITPEGSVGPGDFYDLIITAKNQQGDLCKSCGVALYFPDETKEPGDQIIPNFGRADDNGQFKARITAFSTKERELIVDIRVSEEIMNRNKVYLAYKGNEIVATYRLITAVVSQVGFLPPMGNVYPLIRDQKYLGDYNREINLEWNKPFGAQIYKVSYYPKDGDYSERKTESFFRVTKAQVKVPSREDLNILVSACTTQNDMSCVGPVYLELPKLEASQEATESVLPVPNMGLVGSSYEENQKWLEEEQKHLEGGMFGLFKNWLEDLYNSF